MIYCISLLDYIVAILLSLLHYVIIHISFVHAFLLIRKKKNTFREVILSFSNIHCCLLLLEVNFDSTRDVHRRVQLLNDRADSCIYFNCSDLCVVSVFARVRP